MTTNERATLETLANIFRCSYISAASIYKLALYGAM